VIFLQTEASDILSLVQGLRNFSSPVGRLPPEVLEQILELRGMERDLLTATHVCRHWRDTIMSSPHLWTTFRCFGVARTLQYLERSKPVPINVIADFNSEVQAVIALKSATDRFGSLTLRLQPFDLMQIFRNLVTPAPALERLEVHAAPQCGDGLSFRPAIPATFLGGSTPALKSLHLSGINTKLTFSKFPALTCLTLITNMQVFDVSELFGIFSSAHLLEEFSVQFSGPTTPIPESQGVITLPRMKKLSVSNTVGEFPKGLLALLVMPSAEEIRLEVVLPGEDKRIMRDFLPAQVQNFSHLMKVDNLRLDVPQAHCNTQFSGPGGLVSIHTLRSGSREQNECFQSHWLNSLEPMSIADVKDLTLRSYHPEGSLDRCPVFKSLKALDGVRSLVLERCNNTTVIKALSPTAGGSVLFPHLESLTFHLITEPTTIVPDLTNMARARSQAGFPLIKISSDLHTTFRRSDVDALQRYVDRVELNTRADPRPSEPAKVPSHNIITVRILCCGLSPSRSLIAYHFFVLVRKDSPPIRQKTPEGQTQAHPPIGGAPSANKSKNPLSDLAAMYSR
jgi:hypothetical protein